MLNRSGCQKGPASNDREVVKKKKHSAPFSRIFTRVFEATMDKMDNLIDHLKKLPSSKYHVHETEACRMLKIKAADGGASSCSQTSALKKGDAGCMIDMEQQGVPNAFNIHLFRHGKKEAFTTNRLAANKKVNGEPRWFSFGLKQMDIKKQLLIMKSVTGKASRMDKPTAERRKAIWLDWHNNVSTREFEESHLPFIAHQHRDEWEAKMPADDGISSTRIDAQILRGVAKETRAILVAGNQNLISRTTKSHGRLPNEEPSGESKESEELEEEHVSPPKRQRLSSTSTHNFVSPSPTRRNALPESLKMEALRFIDMHELANVERAIFVQKNESISAREHHRQKQLKEPETISLLTLGNLNPLLLGMASTRIKIVRKELLGRVPGGLFLPNDNDLPLLHSLC
jgi:hypothetical protein